MPGKNQPFSLTSKFAKRYEDEFNRAYPSQNPSRYPTAELITAEWLIKEKGYFQNDALILQGLLNNNGIRYQHEWEIDHVVKMVKDWRDDTKFPWIKAKIT